MTVGTRFSQFMSNLMLTEAQQADGQTKHSGVKQCLNEWYYGSKYAGNGFLVGSWGKSTEIRPPRDIDIMFVLPKEVYDRFEKYSGNKQSQLLQEVKYVLERSYSTTNMSADGQVVIVPFGSYGVEVVPAFALQNGQYWICNTNSGGSYKASDPTAEIKNVKDSNSASGGNTRDLIRMMKRWQEYCNLSLKSFVIELLCIEFIAAWPHKTQGTTFYDWMVRDFFFFLKQKSSWSLVFVPGTYETIYLNSGDWQSKAESAYNRAVKATQYETDNCPYLAGAEWQKIFGADIPTG